MGGDQTDTPLADQGANIGAAANEPLAVVGAAKNFIDGEKEGQCLVVRQVIEQGAQALHLGIEIGDAIHHRIADFDAGEETEAQGMQCLDIDHTTGIGQRQVYTKRLEQRTLAGHVRAGEDRHLAQVVDGEIIAHFTLIWQERVADALADKDRHTFISVKGGEGALGIEPTIASQRAYRFQFVPDG